MISEHDSAPVSEFAHLAASVRARLEKRATAIEGTALASFIAAVDTLVSLPPHEEKDIAEFVHRLVHDKLRSALLGSATTYTSTILRALPDGHMTTDTALIASEVHPTEPPLAYEAFIREGGESAAYETLRAQAKSAMLKAVEEAHEVPEIGELPGVKPSRIASHIADELATLTADIEQLCSDIEEAFVHNGAMRRWVRRRQKGQPELPEWSYDKRDKIALNKQMKSVIGRINSLLADPLTHHGTNVVSAVADQHVDSYLAGNTEKLDTELSIILDDFAANLQDALSKVEPAIEKHATPIAAVEEPEPLQQHREIAEQREEVFTLTNRTAHLPWLEDETRPIGQYTNPYGQSVYYIDGRSDAAWQIEQKHLRNVQDIFFDRWVMAIRSHAGEVAPNAYRTVRKGEGFAAGYDAISEIRYNDNRQANAARVYFTQMPLSDLQEDVTVGSEVDGKVIVLLGRCTKDTQIDMLSLLTTRTARQLREFGAGSR